MSTLKLSALVLAVAMAAIPANAGNLGVEFPTLTYPEPDGADQGTFQPTVVTKPDTQDK